MAALRPSTAFIASPKGERTLASPGGQQPGRSPSGERPKTSGSPTPHSPTAIGRGVSLAALLQRTGTSDGTARATPSPPRSPTASDLVRRRPQTAVAGGAISPTGRSISSPSRPVTAGHVRVESPLRAIHGTERKDRVGSPIAGVVAEGVVSEAALASLDSSNQTRAVESSPRSSPRPQSPLSGPITAGSSLKRSTTLLKESSLLRERIEADNRGVGGAPSAKDLQSTIRNGQVTRLNDVRAAERTKSNQTAFAAGRNTRQEAAHLRHTALRLGEEQKLLGKCKSLLEVGVQEKRKGLSANHQSQAMRQKMPSRDQRLTDECNLALAKEAGQLSQSKRDIEKQLAQVKSQQWEVDKLRKQMLSRVQTLSSGPLALDSHSSKISSYAAAGREQFATSMRRPAKSVMFDSTVRSSDGPSQSGAERSPLTLTKASHNPSVTLISQAESMLASSKQLREDSKGLLLGTTEKDYEAQSATNKHLKESSHRAQLEKNSVTMERGQVRRARAATVHSLSCHELAAAHTRGAAMEEHWDVSEKFGRPLTSVDPSLAEEESRKQKQSVETFNMYASSSATALDRLSKIDTQLAIALRKKAVAHRTELDVMRMRRRSADNRWVQG